MPLHYHPAREYARVEIAANEPSTRRSAIRISHQHVVVHSIEEFLQIKVYDIATTFLHVVTSAAHSIVRPPTRPKAVARLQPRLQ